MKSETKEREAIRLYLLSQASLADASQVEERLLADDAFYQDLLIVEDELIDQYVTGALSEAERKSFETHFLLTPESQQKVRFARNLRKYVRGAGAAQPFEAIATDESPAEALPDVGPPPKKRPFFSFLLFGNPVLSYSLAAVLLLIVFGATWIVIKNWRGSTPQTPRNLLTVVLSPGLTREGAGEFKRIIVSPTTDALKFELLLAADDYQTYTATIKNTDGKTVLTVDNLRAESANGQRVVALNAAQSAIPPGDYKLELGGKTANGDTEKIASYYFGVSAR